MFQVLALAKYKHSKEKELKKGSPFPRKVSESDKIS